jgi:hypothetical protein
MNTPRKTYQFKEDTYDSRAPSQAARYGHADDTVERKKVHDASGFPRTPLLGIAVCPAIRSVRTESVDSGVLAGYLDELEGFA